MGLTSKNGKKLLNELSFGKNASLKRILDLIDTDANAGLLPNADGNTAFHIILKQDFDESFVLQVLEALIARKSQGVRRRDSSGNVALHVALSQPVLRPSAILMILGVDSRSASESTSESNLTPLLLSVMRDNAYFDVTDAIAGVAPETASRPNSTGSFPLHFAARRRNPDVRILALLVRLYPRALVTKNNYGLTPFQACCSQADELKATKFLFEATKKEMNLMSNDGVEHESIQQLPKNPALWRDSYGKTCLHLAVEAVAQERNLQLAAEESRLEMDHLSTKLPALKISGHQYEDTGDDGCEEEEGSEETPKVNTFQEVNFRRRREIIQFLISEWPYALVATNNFGSMPVSCVISKEIVKTKFRSNRPLLVSKFGIYHDPVTCRMLLMAHKGLISRGIVSTATLRSSMTSHLHDLNFGFRFLPLLLTLEGTSEGVKFFSGSSKKNQVKGKGKRLNRTGGRKLKRPDSYDFIYPVSVKNIFARLRRDVGVPICAEWMGYI